MSWVCVSNLSVKFFFFCKVFEHKLNDVSYFEPAVKAPHNFYYCAVYHHLQAEQ